MKICLTYLNVLIQHIPQYLIHLLSTDGILKLIKSLKLNKASGPDNISARVLTICAKEIAPILTVLFTQSFNSGELPNDWSTVNITPIH